jgi:hypothetical protein
VGAWAGVYGIRASPRGENGGRFEGMKSFPYFMLNGESLNLFSIEEMIDNGLVLFF